MTGRDEIFKLGKDVRFFNRRLGLRPAQNGCGDNCSIEILCLSPQLGKISFCHEGCILSRAAINALIGEIENKTREEALSLLFKFRSMITGGEASFGPDSCLSLFSKFCHYPSRRPCLLLGCDTLIKLLNGKI